MEQRARFYSDDEKTLAWSETADIVKAYSDEMIQRWKEEIDTLLVFVRKPFSLAWVRFPFPKTNL